MSDLHQFLTRLVHDNVQEHEHSNVVVTSDPALTRLSVSLLDGKKQRRAQRRKTRRHMLAADERNLKSEPLSASRTMKPTSILKKQVQQYSFDSDLSGGHEVMSPPRLPYRPPPSPIKQSSNSAGARAGPLSKPLHLNWESSAVNKESVRSSSTDAYILADFEPAPSATSQQHLSTRTQLWGNLSPREQDPALISVFADATVHCCRFGSSRSANEISNNENPLFGIAQPRVPGSEDSWDVPPRLAHRMESQEIHTAFP
jgi:hypothetical protein